MRTQARGIHGGIFATAAALFLLNARVGLPARTAPPADPVIVTSAPPRMATFPQPDSEMNPWRSMGALFLALCGLSAATYFLKRRGIVGFGALNLRRVRIIEKYPIDTKRALLLVAMDDHELLLGVGPDRITPLHRQRRPHSHGERGVALTKDRADP